MIVAARRVPPAAGGPHPRRISARRPAAACSAGLVGAGTSHLANGPSEPAGGFTGRANSCHAVGDPGMPIASRPPSRSSRFARRPRHRSVAQVIDGSPERLALRRLGWIDTYQPTDVLVSRLADFLGIDRPSHRSKITEALQPDWEEAYQRSRPNSADPAIVRMILDGNPPRAFAAVRPMSPTSHRARRDCPRAPQRGLARTGVDLDHVRSSPAGLGDQDDGRTRTLGCSAGRPLRVPAGGLVNEAAIAAYQRLGFVQHHATIYLAPCSVRAAPVAERSPATSGTQPTLRFLAGDPVGRGVAPVEVLPA